MRLRGEKHEASTADRGVEKHIFDPTKLALGNPLIDNGTNYIHHWSNVVFDKPLCRFVAWIQNMGEDNLEQPIEFLETFKPTFNETMQALFDWSFR